MRDDEEKGRKRTVKRVEGGNERKLTKEKEKNREDWGSGDKEMRRGKGREEEGERKVEVGGGDMKGGEG